LSAAAPASGYRATDGAAYERFLGRWTARLASPFSEFARLPLDGAVLDIGCGTGSLALALAERRPGPIVGVDLAEPYIAFARTKPGADRVSFELGDASRLSYADGSFAGALAQLVLIFVPDPAAVVGEMRRVTRQGGVVAAAIWDFRGGLVYQRLFWDTAAGIDPTAGLARDRLFSHPLAQPEGLAELWHGAGLAEVDVGSLASRMDFSSFEDYWEPLFLGQGPVGTYAQSLTPDMKLRLRERVRAAYLSGSPDGPRSLTATAWAVRGVVR
jgi:SAM-dependent methyltransferase